MKILAVDLEVAPNRIRSWGVWETDSLEVETDWYLLCFSYRWLHLKETHVVALPDFKNFKKDREDDSEVVKALWKLFDEADAILAHNGDAYDAKKARTRFVVHGLPPPAPVIQIDTKKMAKSTFGFASNKLDELGRQLGLGRKESTGGYDLWRGCMAGDPKAWAKMKKYNKQDVDLLVAVYEKLKAWSKSQPNWNLHKDADCCPGCGSVQIEKRGFAYTRSTARQRYQCLRCGHWFQGETVETRKLR